MADVFTAAEVRQFEAAMRARRAAEAEAEAKRPPFTPPSAFSREEIASIYAARRRGEWRGTEAEWMRLEASLIRAAAEGRVAGAIDTWGRGEKGPPK
jgi:hypothetical protein